MDETDVKISLLALDALETRERLLDAETLIIGDEYLFIRDAYFQSREYEILNGEVEVDDFLEFLEDIFEDN